MRPSGRASGVGRAYAGAACARPLAWHANQFAQQACWFYAERYQILYSVHEDAQNIHIHFVMNMISFQDGTRYTGKKKDYYDFLRYLNDIAALFGTYVYPVKDKPE